MQQVGHLIRGQNVTGTLWKISTLALLDCKLLKVKLNIIHDQIFKYANQALLAFKWFSKFQR